MQSDSSPTETVRSEFEVWLRYVGRPQIESELAAIETRLGTAYERAGDGESFQAPAHRLSILLNRLEAASGIGQADKPANASPNLFQMNAIGHKLILGQLRWRYATKRFDPYRKISSEDWAVFQMALVLSPSSYGLQPWKFVVVSDSATRKRLVSASHDQRQIAEASHLVVFAVRTDFGEKDVDAHLRRMSEVRHVSVESLASTRVMLVNAVVLGMDEPTRLAWESRQAYVALGFLLASAALLGVDACPIEDIATAEYDTILGLQAKRLTTVVACALGYRSAGDKCASLPKVRFRTEDILLHV